MASVNFNGNGSNYDSNLKYERHGKNVRIYNPDAPKNIIGSAGSLVSFDSKAEADAFVKQHTVEENKPSMSLEDARVGMLSIASSPFGYIYMMTPKGKEVCEAWKYYKENGMA